MLRTAVLLALALGALPAWSSAQDTRVEVLERQRAEKARELKPYEPSTLEKLVMNAEEGRIRRLITPHNGFFADYGYTYKPVGSGIAFGGGFRHDLFDRRARVELEAGASFRKYQMLRADFFLPRLAGDRLELGIEGTYKRHPQEDFYGTGFDSVRDDRVSYLFTGREVQGRAIVTLKPWLRVGTRFGRLAPSVGRGTDQRFPSIEEQFDDVAAPGLIAQPNFGFMEGFAEVDHRDEPGNARAGGYYRLSWRKNTDRELDRYSFDTVDLLLQHFVPIFDKKRVFAFQTGLIASNPQAGHEVPFYLRPTVGGSRTVRSVADYRFRDTHALWMNAEYRWEAFGLLDMALFTDWGKVAPRTSDLDFSDLKHAYGIGFRFNTDQIVFLRIDIATGGGEGVRYFFKLSKVF
ncbi:MAG: BamA/TamA family outer membrane protein [Vicinamibacterales bacterium]